MRQIRVLIDPNDIEVDPITFAQAVYRESGEETVEDTLKNIEKYIITPVSELPDDADEHTNLVYLIAEDN